MSVNTLNIPHQIYYNKWKYLFYRADELARKPKTVQQRVFFKLFPEAEVCCFDEAETAFYQQNLKYYRDLKNSLDTAHEEGREEGREEANIVAATKMKKAGLPLEQISQFTGLSIDQIKQIH